jgi:hypothetical protein
MISIQPMDMGFVFWLAAAVSKVITPAHTDNSSRCGCGIGIG